MLEKKHYLAAEIKISCISMQDIITTSNDSILGKEDWDEGGWTTTISN